MHSLCSNALVPWIVINVLTCEFHRYRRFLYIARHYFIVYDIGHSIKLHIWLVMLGTEMAAQSCLVILAVDSRILHFAYFNCI